MKDSNNNKIGTQIHHGENVRFFRDVMLGWSQEYFASQMNIHQSDLSKLEYQETIHEDKLKVIAKVFGIDVNALQYRNLRNEARTIIFSGEHTSYNEYYENIINPLEKVSELYERIVKLEVENEQLKNQLKKVEY